MKFAYSKHGLGRFEAGLQRMLEILPGAVSWMTLIGMIVLSILRPSWAAIIIIAFYLYWFFRLIYMTIFLALSYLRLSLEKDTDWMAQIRLVDHLDTSLKDFRKAAPLPLNKRLLRTLRYFDLKTLQRSRRRPPPSEEIFHLIIYPVVKEDRDILEPAVRSLKDQNFPNSRMLVVYALEERAEERIKETVFALEKKYKSDFLDVQVMVHPADRPGEARVKGANVTWAARQATAYLEKKNIPFENVIVSCFDADTVVSPSYFACLTYTYMITPHRTQSSYQPIPVYHNNIWDVPGFARVIECGASFFQLIEATNPEKLVTFSSHSMSFKALVDVDYWPVDMISDDSAIFWKAFIHYDGRYRVVPMYVTLSMDVAGSDQLWETARSVYKQKRRWAWGVENFPIVMRAFFKNRTISLYDKIRHSFKLFEGHVSWATWGFLLSIIGWLPGIFAHREYLTSVVYYNAPQVTHTIFRLGILSLIVSIIISLRLLPRSDKRTTLRRRIKHAFEWLMIPLILIIFSALPALDAQTRLMLGRHMEFWVTDKVRKKGSPS